jgi:hypothetical protein
MFARKNFASYLDRLLARDRGSDRVRVEGPSLRVDLLDQIERIKTNTPSLADEPAIERYRAAELALSGADSSDPGRAHSPRRPGLRRVEQRAGRFRPPMEGSGE